MAEKSSGGLRTNLEVSYVPRYENCGEVSIIGSDKWSQVGLWSHWENNALFWWSKDIIKSGDPQVKVHLSKKCLCAAAARFSKSACKYLKNETWTATVHEAKAEPV